MEEDIKLIEHYMEYYSKDYIFRKAIKNLIKGYKGLEECLKAEEKYAEGLNNDIKSLLNIEPNNNFILKSKVREVLDTKYIVMFEGDTEFPDDATIMKTVKYVKVSDIEQLLQEGDK